MSGNYDVQQVCENGHQITGCCNLCPEEKKEFCKDCGAPTITACPSCGKEIQGTQIEVLQTSWIDARQGGGGKMVPGRPADVPSYCERCGKPYPWTENKIMAAIQVFAELGIDENEEDTIDDDMHNIARDIPQAKPSAIRIKRICEKLGPLAYNVVMEFATKTTAEILKGNMS